MSKIKILAILTIFTLPTLSLAASMVESRDGQGVSTRIYMDGDQARIEMPGNMGYSVMDVRKRTMYVVLHNQRAIMNLSSYMQAGTPPPAAGGYVDSFLQTKGLGAKILGYETEEQEIYVNNKYCGSVFVSVRALNELKLKPFAKALESMSQQIQQSLTGMTGAQLNQMMNGSCEQGKKNLLDQLVNIGFPMKSIDQNRRLESVVTNLTRKTKLPANAFVVPKNYRVVTPAQLMQEAMQNTVYPPVHGEHYDDQYYGDAPHHNPPPRHVPTPHDVIDNIPPVAREIIKHELLNLGRH